MSIVSWILLVPYLYAQKISLVFKKVSAILMPSTLYVVSKGTTVNICSIDLSKAFYKVNHCALFIKLTKRHFPVQLLDIIVNLLTGCLSCVKWDSIYSINQSSNQSKNNHLQK